MTQWLIVTQCFILTRLPEVSFKTLSFLQIIYRLLLTSCPFNAAQSKIRVQNASNGICLVIGITPFFLPPAPTSWAGAKFFGRQAGDPPPPPSQTNNSAIPYSPFLYLPFSLPATTPSQPSILICLSWPRFEQFNDLLVVWLSRTSILPLTN